MRTALCVAMIIMLGVTDTVATHQLEPLSLEMQEYEYPYPVRYFPLKLHAEESRMAYMDIRPNGPAQPHATVVLFHGKNFFGAYWKPVIEALREANYRIIVPDQIGFGKSSKPSLPYSFHQMATDTRELLESLGIPRVVIVGHSMGGMLAVRFALMFPAMTSGVALENPIGLEDYRRIVPFVPTDELVQQTLRKSLDDVLAYHRSYYASKNDAFGEYARVQYRMQIGSEGKRWAYVASLTSQMIYEQPVCHELSDLKTPTLLVIGQSDRTAVGKDRVVREIAATLGNYPALGRKAAEVIPGARLVEMPDVGHVPHLEATEKFNTELLRFLREPLRGH